MKQTLKNRVKSYLTFTTAVAVLILAFACNSTKSKQQESSSFSTQNDDSITVVTPEYAQGFTVKYLDNGVRLVDVVNHQEGMGKGMKESMKDGMKKDMKKGKHHAKNDSVGEKKREKMPVGYRFALVRKGSKADIPEGYTRVEVPIERTICMTSLQLSNFTALDAHDVVKGITSTKNLFDKDIRERVKKGDIVKIGMEGEFDPELILAANPDVIFISPFKRGGYATIKETGILLIPHMGYKELHPLGQAEWMKFVAMFIGKEKEANELFDGIAKRYNDLKALVEKTDTRPTVFSGEMHGGNWFAVGGRNHLAQMFRDAGATYILDNDETGGTPIEYEQMYATAANADYWRILNSYPGDFSYEALKRSEPRNELFKAFKEKHVIYCNMKQTPYYEITPVQPDVLLKDLVAIFHPEVLSEDYQPKFYRLLK